MEGDPRVRSHADAGWHVELPVGVTGGPARHSNPELSTIAVYRGWVGDDAMFAAVSTRPLKFSSLRQELRYLSRHFNEGAADGIPVDILGADGARRVDGLADIEEGYGEAPTWTERVTIIGARRGRELVILTVRRHPTADLDDVVERIASSFTLTA